MPKYGDMLSVRLARLPIDPLVRRYHFVRSVTMRQTVLPVFERSHKATSISRGRSADTRNRAGYSLPNKTDIDPQGEDHGEQERQQNHRD